MSDQLCSLPRELLEYALASFLEPVDIAAAARTCKVLSALTSRQNTFFWRNVYLNAFDDPRVCHQFRVVSDFDWWGILTNRVRAERQRNSIIPFLDAIADCIRTIPVYSSTLSADLTWVERMVKERTAIFSDGLTVEGSSPEGGSNPMQNIQEDLALTDRVSEEKRMFIRASLSRLLRPSAEAARVRRRLARAYVYDMRNYVPSALWGPLMPGASTPCWTHIDALISVVAANLRDFGPEWPSQLQPPALMRGAESLRPYSATLSDTRLPIDWAGVGGEWMRVVSFCDYRDLIRFNHGHRRSEFFHDEFEEATRLLRMDLTVTGVAEDVDSADPARPALRFEGKMRGFSSLEDLDRRVRGVVRVLPSGDIHWSSVSHYQGVDQWSSEGIQLGGPGSAAGVVGAWSGASHAAGDPAGPFWSFRMSDPNIMEKIRGWPM